MDKLFGIPVGALALVLVGALAASLAALGILAVRNRVLLRLGVRNVGRRRGRSALIVVGLMLGTAIITAALATGDTMSQTIRSTSIRALGQTDEVVSAAGAKQGFSFVAGGGATGAGYFPQSYYRRIAATLAGSALVDGVTPAIIEPVAALDVGSRQTEPQMTLFASDPAHMTGFGTIHGEGGRDASLAELRPGEVFLNKKSAEELSARRGDVVRVLAGRSALTARVREIVSFDGAGSAKSTLLLPLSGAQRLLGEPGRIREVLISNRGGAESGAALSGRVVDLLRPTVAPLGLEVRTTKKDALEAADAAGSAFMSFFTTFGSFSIAAGILLIFLIFVMLAAERRGELGIARAVGTRRAHLVQMFVFEGIAYDLAAAAVGALLGIAVAYGMVLVMAGAFNATSELQVAYAVKPASVVVAYAIGVLLTLAVVAFSARRVSRMNIVSAIRDLPEPLQRRGSRRRAMLGAGGIAAGALLAYSGAAAMAAVPFSLGVSLILLSLLPILRYAGVSDRLARTAVGLVLVVWFVLPMQRWLLGEMKMDFSIFIVSGLMIVVGATLAVMYNADVLLAGLNRIVGRSRGLAPVLKVSIAYPMRSLFRTGVTLAMFTLVVFTLVVGATITGAFTNAFDDLGSYGGGFQIRATTSPASPIGNMRAALRRAPGINPASFTVVSSQSVLPVKARQLGGGSKPEDYVARGLDNAFLRHTTYGMAAMANGYGSARAVWAAVRSHPGLAVVDPAVVPRRFTGFTFGALQKFQLHGFYLEDKRFSPVRLSLRDPQTGRRLRLTVIGVLSETAPLQMVGISTSQRTLSAAFGNRVRPTVHLFALRPGVDAETTATALNSAFLAYGMHAEALSKLLTETVDANRTINLLVEGFMGLGLIVGVAALGVISARAVVERRQQIGVLRAIGFRRRMVQLSFLIESSFVSLSAIVVGTALGLAVAYNVIHDFQRSPSWSNMAFAPPWLALGAIFLAVYLIALVTTFAPALRASRVYPAEALRYQ